MCCSIIADTRRSFDGYYRALLNGGNPQFPKPERFRLTKHQIFPEKSLVWDYIYDKRGQGSWVTWSEMFEKTVYPPTAKVSNEFKRGYIKYLLFY